jgi:hypothetical protein
MAVRSGTEAALLAFIVALTALIFLILITPELKALAVILWDAWL